MCSSGDPGEGRSTPLAWGRAGFVSSSGFPLLDASGKCLRWWLLGAEPSS